DAALCSPERWDEIRTDVLDGWTERGGRLWHSTVTELATDAASKLRKNKGRTTAAREALEQKRTTSVTGTVTDVVTAPVADPVGTVTDIVTGPEGKGSEGKEKEAPSGASKKRAARLPDDWTPSAKLVEWAQGESLA